MPKLSLKLRREVLAYLQIHHATQEERREVWRWIHSGESVRNNPWYCHAENGWPMDFISAMRFNQEQYEYLASLTPEERERALGTHETPPEDLSF